MNNNKVISEGLPCEPASARRPSVPGPGGVKNVTEGGGGVVPQAPPPANAPGDNAAVVNTPSSAGPAVETGPVLKTKKKRPGSKTRRSQANRKERAAAAAEPGAAVLNAGGPETGSGEASSPSSFRPTVGKMSKIGQMSRKQIRRARVQRDAELAVLASEHRKLIGTMHPPSVAALAPAIGAIFAQTAGSQQVKTTPPMAGCAPNLALDPPQDRSMELDLCLAGPSSAGGGASRHQGGEIFPETHTTGFTPELVSPDVVVASQSTADDSEPRTQPQSRKGKGKGKGRYDEAGRCEQPCAMDTPTPNKAENTRVAKRQRSSDLVSPSSAAVEKKVRTATGPQPAVMVAPSAGQASTNNAEGAIGPSFAEVAKSHFKMVILDKSGTNFTELQAAIIRQELDEACAEDVHQHIQMNLDDAYLIQSPSFAMLPKLFRGGLKVVAENEFTLNWLTTLVENLPGRWAGSGGYRLVQESKLPAFLRGTVFVPNLDGNADYVRRFLAYPNNTKTLLIHRWPIYVHKIIKTKTATHNVMVFGVPVEDEAELYLRNCRLTYKSATVYIQLRKPRAGDVRGAVVGPAAPTTGESLEVGVAEALTPVVEAISIPVEKELSPEEIDKFIESMSGGEGETVGGLSLLSLDSPAPDDLDELPDAPAADGSQTTQ